MFVLICGRAVARLNSGVSAHKPEHGDGCIGAIDVTKFLISFPSAAMVIPEADRPAVSEASRAVVRAAKDAGVWFYGGAITGSVPAVMVSGDGTMTTTTYPQTASLEGGYAILELPSRGDALQWAARFAVACRCSQEVREFHYDPES